MRRLLARKVATAIILIASKVRVFLFKRLHSTNLPVVKGGRIVQATQFVGRGSIRLDGVQIGVWPSPGLLTGASYVEARNVGAVVEILQDTIINNNAVIIADKSFVRIGRRCLIGGGFFVCDSDFHGVELSDRRNGGYVCEGVTIEDDVFIGQGVKVLKGVTVGRGAVIGSGSVVVNDVEEFSVFAGVPARMIKRLSRVDE